MWWRCRRARRFERSAHWRVIEHSVRSLVGIAEWRQRFRHSYQHRNGTCALVAAAARSIERATGATRTFFGRAREQHADGRVRQTERVAYASRYRPWAELLRRTFGIGVETCHRCSGRMRLLALVTERNNVARFLRHLGEPTEPPPRAAARDPPYWPRVATSHDEPSRQMEH